MLTNSGPSHYSPSDSSDDITEKGTIGIKPSDFEKGTIGYASSANGEKGTIGFKPLVLSVLASTFITACSGTPQYTREAPPNPQITPNSQLPGRVYIPLPEPDTADSDDGDNDTPISDQNRDEDAMAARNTEKPIIYNVGAGGITYETTYEESRRLLSEPQQSPDFAGGSPSFYRSQMAVFWTPQAPHTPTSFVLLRGYKGALQIGGEFGNVALGDSLAQHYTGSSDKGEEMLKGIYRELEDAPEDFDCLSEALCELKEDDQFYIYILAGNRLIMWVDKNRKNFYEARLVKTVPQGKLNAPLDLSDGSFNHVTQSELGPAVTRFELGKTWGEYTAQLAVAAEAQVRVNTRSFFKTFSGIGLALTKSHFERSYEEPDATERVTGATVYGGYRKNFTLRGAKILLARSADGVSVHLEGQDNVPPNAQPMTLDTSIPPAHQVQFMRDLLELVKTKLQADRPELQVVTSLNGLHGFVGVREFTAGLLAYDPQSRTGVSVGFEIPEIGGDLSYLGVSLLDQPLDRIMLPNYLEDVALGSDELLGIQIGNAITIQDTDLGRGEATVSLTIDGQAMTVRGAYSPDSSVRASFGGPERTYPLHVVALGGVTLGVKPSASQPEEGQIQGKIASISTASLYKKIANVCPSVELEIGQEASSVRDVLTPAIAAGCGAKLKTTGDGFNRLSSVEIPNRRAKVFLSDNELSSVLIYADQNLLEGRE